MRKKTLHIISLDIPYPPNRGSVVGIFNRIKAFHEAGVEIILHSFYKEFKAPEALAQYCKTIYLYQREPIWKIKSLKWPLYIQSRRSDQLVSLLSKDDAPILFEGLHTLYHLNDPLLKNKKKYIRLHNAESTYYQHLADLESNPIKKWYYQYESSLSNKVEQAYLPSLNGLFPLSIYEAELFSKLNSQTWRIPPFINQQLDSGPGLGSYALFHGDLTINENELAIKFLIGEVFNGLEFPLTIAGFKPSRQLKNLVKMNKNLTLVDSPDILKMDDLIQNAQIILAPIRQTTGYKMKLLQSLVLGRHIITSPIAKIYNDLFGVIHLAGHAVEWKQVIKQLIDKPVPQNELEVRKHLLETTFNNKANADKMLEIIFS